MIFNVNNLRRRQIRYWMCREISGKFRIPSTVIRNVSGMALPGIKFIKAIAVLSLRPNPRTISAGPQSILRAAAG